jgi:hypothetical protein
MSARIFPGLLQKLLDPSQGMLALIEHSKRRSSSLGRRELWVDQVQHWLYTGHHLATPALPEILVLPELELSLNKNRDLW